MPTGIVINEILLLSKTTAKTLTPHCPLQVNRVAKNGKKQLRISKKNILCGFNVFLYVRSSSAFFSFSGILYR
jgi:hypothetical protein